MPSIRTIIGWIIGIAIVAYLIKHPMPAAHFVKTAVDGAGTFLTALIS
jgi:hypothetical protein